MDIEYRQITENKRPLIDRPLPVMTGDKDRDMWEVYNHLAYLTERMNFIFTLIYQQIDKNKGG